MDERLKMNEPYASRKSLTSFFPPKKAMIEPMLQKKLQSEAAHKKRGYQVELQHELISV